MNTLAVTLRNTLDAPENGVRFGVALLLLISFLNIGYALRPVYGNSGPGRAVGIPCGMGVHCLIPCVWSPQLRPGIREHSLAGLPDPQAQN